MFKKYNMSALIPVYTKMNGEINKTLVQEILHKQLNYMN